MSYLEEVLSEFRKGAKIRRKEWPEASCISINRSMGLHLSPVDTQADDWEFYQEPINWDYIIKNKCLCWFWDNGESKIGKTAGILTEIIKDASLPFIKDAGEDDYTVGYSRCCPVYRDEVTFYEDRKDD